MHCVHIACLESEMFWQGSHPAQHYQLWQRPVACPISSGSVYKRLHARVKKELDMKALEHHHVSEGILPHLCSLFSLRLPTMCLVVKIMFLVLWGWNILRIELVRVQLWGLGTRYILGTALGSLVLCISAVLVTPFLGGGRECYV